MGLDVDYVFAKKAIDNIKKMVSDTPHGEREKITDDIIEFEGKLAKKFGFESAFKDTNFEHPE